MGGADGKQQMHAGGGGATAPAQGFRGDALDANKPNSPNMNFNARDPSSLNPMWGGARYGMPNGPVADPRQGVQHFGGPVTDPAGGVQHVQGTATGGTMNPPSNIQPSPLQAPTMNPSPLQPPMRNPDIGNYGKPPSQGGKGGGHTAGGGGHTLPVQGGKGGGGGGVQGGPMMMNPSGGFGISGMGPIGGLNLGSMGGGMM